MWYRNPTSRSGHYLRELCERTERGWVNRVDNHDLLDGLYKFAEHDFHGAECVAAYSVTTRLAHPNKPHNVNFNPYYVVVVDVLKKD